MKNDYIVRKLYMSFVIVSILSALAATLGMLIDNIIVGQFIGETGMAAMGIVAPLALVFSAIGNIASGGGTARAAQAIGRGDTPGLRQIFSCSIYFSIIAGAVLTILGLIFTEPLARLLGADDELLPYVTDYMRGYFLGAVPTLLVTTLSGFVKIDGSPRLPLIVIVVMSAVNITLDLVMVLVFDLGMFGMAIATTIAYCVALLVALTHFRKKYATLRLVKLTRLKEDLMGMTITGAPTALSRVCDTIQMAVLNNVLASISVAAVAAFNVRTQAYTFFGSFILGVAQASVPIIGMFYGEEDQSAMASTLKATFTRGLIINGIAAVILFILAPTFAAMLGLSGGEAGQMAITAVQLLAVTMPLSLLVNAMIAFYQASRNTVNAALICVLERLVLVLAFAFLLLPVMGVTGVWLSYLFSEILTLLIIVLITAIRLHRFPTHVADFVQVAEGFGGNPKNRLDISIGNNMDEVMTVSTGILKFGETRDIDHRTLEILSLCIEEMAGNVVQHAFKPGEKRWLDVLILDKPDRISVRLRDNGAPFEPNAYLNSGATGDNAYGIRMISGLADTMEYRRTMGLLNNLYIDIGKNHSLGASEKDTPHSTA